MTFCPNCGTSKAGTENFCHNCGFSFVKNVSVDSILSKIFKSERGIKRLIISDNNGLIIASVSKSSYLTVDVDGIGAITTANFIASEKAGRDLGLAELVIITCEFTEGKVFSVSVGKGVLSLVSDPHINIGLIRLILGRFRDIIGEILERLLTNANPRDYRDLDKDWEDKDFATA